STNLKASNRLTCHAVNWRLTSHACHRITDHFVVVFVIFVLTDSCADNNFFKLWYFVNVRKTEFGLKFLGIRRGIQGFQARSGSGSSCFSHYLISLLPAWRATRVVPPSAFLT